MNFRKMNAWLMAVSLTATAAGSSTMPLYIDAAQLGIRSSANEETLKKDSIKAEKNEKDYDVDPYGVVTKYNGEKTDIIIPEKKHGRKICEVGQGAFQNRKDISSAVLSEGITGIEKDAFFNCVSLKSVKFPDTLSSIGIGAFQNCAQLQKIDLSKTAITKLSEGTFQNCRNLEEVILPKGLQEIEANVFYGCGNLKSIYLTNLKKLTKIGSGAFANCISLTKLAIPQGVDSIAGGAFANCIGLEEITIPGKVQKLGLAVLVGNKNVMVKGIKHSLAYDYAMKNKLGFTSISEQILASMIELSGEDIIINKTNTKQLTLKEGAISKLQFHIPKETTDKSVSWTCSKEGVVQISEDGSITGVKKGFTIVEVKANGGIHKRDTVEVSVI